MESAFSIGGLILLLSLNTYPLFIIGWSSNSVFSSIGRLRGVAQAVSYEIRLALVLLCVLCIYLSMSLSASFTSSAGSVLLILPLLILWGVTCVAETNRTPFDFAEGESELVSGFNTEFGAGGFAVIFIAEYARILGLRAVTMVLFFGVAPFSLRGGVGIRVLGGI